MGTVRCWSFQHRLKVPCNSYVCKKLEINLSLPTILQMILFKPAQLLRSAGFQGLVSVVFFQQVSPSRRFPHFQQVPLQWLGLWQFWGSLEPFAFIYSCLMQGCCQDFNPRVPLIVATFSLSISTNILFQLDLRRLIRLKVFSVLFFIRSDNKLENLYSNRKNMTS